MTMEFPRRSFLRTAAGTAAGTVLLGLGPAVRDGGTPGALRSSNRVPSGFPASSRFPALRSTMRRTAAARSC